MSAKNYIAVLLIVLLFPAPASAQSWGDVAWFFAGAAVPIVAHELGHELAAEGDIEWRGTRWHCVRPCNQSRIAAAGFVSEAVVSDVIARAFDAPSQHSFRNGIRAFNVIHPLLYVARSSGDLYNFNDRDRKTARIVLMIFAAYSFVQIEF